MPKGFEDNKGAKKKAKWSLKEKRQRKKDKKMRSQTSQSTFTEHPDVII